MNIRSELRQELNPRTARCRRRFPRSRKCRNRSPSESVSRAGRRCAAPSRPIRERIVGRRMRQAAESLQVAEIGTLAPDDTAKARRRVHEGASALLPREQAAPLEVGDRPSERAPADTKLLGELQLRRAASSLLRADLPTPGPPPARQPGCRGCALRRTNRLRWARLEV